jgi:hypothetical protein
MRNYLLAILFFSVKILYCQSQVQIDVLSPKPSIAINGDPCNIGNLTFSCTPKTCNTVVITEGDSIEFCTHNEIYLTTDTNYYMQWNFTGCSNLPTSIDDSFPTPTPLCYYPRWDVAGNYTVDVYYNGWLSAYPYSDCYSFGPSHWIIDIVVMQNMGIVPHERNLTCEIFPNPGTGIFNLQISDPEKIEEIYLTNIPGEKIPLEYNQYRIDLTEFPSGIYFLNIKTEEGILIKKLVRE